MAVPYNPGIVAYKWDGINLREEFDDTLAQHGHYIYLRRSDRRQRCVCFDKNTGTKNAKCSICNEDGYIYEEEKHLSRSRNASLARAGTTETKGEARDIAGYVDINGRIYYLRYDVHPRVEDEIAERDDNGDLFELWDIESADAFRDKFGRIEFYRCACSRITMGKRRETELRDIGQVDSRQ